MGKFLILKGWLCELPKTGITSNSRFSKIIFDELENMALITPVVEFHNANSRSIEFYECLLAILIHQEKFQEAARISLSLFFQTFLIDSYNPKLKLR